MCEIIILFSFLAFIIIFIAAIFYFSITKPTSLDETNAKIRYKQTAELEKDIINNQMKSYYEQLKNKKN